MNKQKICPDMSGQQNFSEKRDFSQKVSTIAYKVFGRFQANVIRESLDSEWEKEMLIKFMGDIYKLDIQFKYNP